MFGGGADRAGEVEFVGGTLAHPAPEPLQGHFDVARAELDRVVIILELAPVPNLDGAAVARLVLADPHTLGIVAIGAEGRGAGGTDPF
ncbi:hypothetical protein D3C86_2084820 [compost metagenome]